MSSCEGRFPSVAGSYLLILYLPRRMTLTIGRLGSFSFCRGWYFYTGSAFGPGGLKARLRHHLKPLQRYHWHIDYLRSAAELRSVWYQPGVNNEHLWSASLISSLPEARFPVARFGSSDCRCASHLVYLSRRPGPGLVRSALGAGAELESCLLSGPY